MVLDQEYRAWNSGSVTFSDANLDKAQKKLYEVAFAHPTRKGAAAGARKVRYIIIFV